MAAPLGPGLQKEMAEAKAALARHGIVIARTVETDLPPAVMAEARAALEAVPRKLAALGEKDLDRLIERIRKASVKSSHELADIYTRLLTSLGTMEPGELLQELEGIGELFRWQRISQAVEAPSAVLEEKGFGKIELGGPDDLSESLRIELAERWPAALKLLREMASRAAEEQMLLEAEEPPAEKKRKPAKRR